MQTVIHEAKRRAAPVPAGGTGGLRIPLRRDSLPEPPTVRELQREEHADWLPLRLPDRRQLPSAWRRLAAWLCCAGEVVQAYDRERARYRTILSRCQTRRAEWLQDLQVQWEARYGEGLAGDRVCELLADEVRQREARALLDMRSRQVQQLPNDSLRAGMDALADASRAHDRVTRTDLKRLRATPQFLMDATMAHRVAQALLDQVLCHPGLIERVPPYQREQVHGRVALRSSLHDLLGRSLRLSVDITLGSGAGRLRAADLVRCINDLLALEGLPRQAAAITGFGRDEAADAVMWFAVAR